MRFDQTSSDIFTFKDQVNSRTMGLPLLQCVNRGVESRYLPSAAFGRNQKTPNHSLPRSTSSEPALSEAEWGRL